MKREEVNLFDVIHDFMDTEHPLSVGNGNLAVTVDGIGTQTFYEEYQIPLISMSATCFVTDKHRPDLVPQIYQAHCHQVGYYTVSKGQEAAYQRLRAYPYKFHFFLYELWNQDGKLKLEDITQLEQRLDLYEGVITSRFEVGNKTLKTNCMVDEQAEVFRFEIEQAQGMQIRILFPKSSCQARGSEYPSLDAFTYEHGHIVRFTERERFDAYLNTNMDVEVTEEAIILSIGDPNAYFEMAIHEPTRYQATRSFFDDVHARLLSSEESGFSPLECQELNRRMVLSIYLLKVNCCGSFPPAETGLTMNSWNSKFHLEMHPWHSLWLARYGLADRLIRQLDYYGTILEESKKRAQQQGYLGARFPKMTSFMGEDSPSNIGPLLLWQQPHFILMLDACYQATQDVSLLKRYESILDEEILFLESFVYFKEDGFYHLDYPIIPAQECYDPLCTRDPIFEVEYVRFAFQKMIQIKKTMGKEVPQKWYDIIEHLVKPACNDSVYLACHDAQGLETYRSFAYDHPLVLMPYSLFVSDRIDPDKMKRTLNKVLESYQLKELWGWDFPMMALTALHLGMKKEAKDLLLLNTPKNDYRKNGHNRQGSRKDLPLYLPGNGAFLLAFIELMNC